MKALIDTIFSPLIGWLNQTQDFLTGAPIVQGYNIPFSNLLAPIAMISPAWALLITNIFVMAAVYLIALVVSNSTGIIERFRSVIKWW